MTPHGTIARVLAGTLFLASVAACGGGGDGDRDGLSSVSAAIAQIPRSVLDSGEGTSLEYTDYDAAAEASGIGRARGEEASQWLVRLQRPVSDDGAGLLVLVPQRFQGAFAEPQEVEDELGFAPSDIDAYVSLSSPPTELLVLAGSLRLSGDLEDLGGGIRSAGTGPDLEIDIEARTAARPLGRPLRIAARDGLVALSTSTDLAAQWGVGPTLADDERLAAVATALDRVGVVSALVVRDSFASDGIVAGDDLPPVAVERIADSLLDVPFDSVGIGSGIDADGTFEVAVYAFADDAAARDAGAQLTTLAREGTSLRTGRALVELVDLGSVSVDGSTVTLTVRVRPDEPGGRLVSMMLSRDVLFLHR